MSVADSPSHSPSNKHDLTLSRHDWEIVDHALEDVHLKEVKAELTVPSPGIPPAIFGAGGPMLAALAYMNAR